MNIILIGFMGTGKTVVGKRVSDKLKRPFRDMDALLEKEQGMTVARIFTERGEAFFRDKESELVQRLTREDGTVVACGGGVVLNSDNVRDLSKCGILIALTADIDTLIKRLGSVRGRPLLAGPDIRKRIKTLFDERRPLYDKIQTQIDTSGRTVEEVVNMVLEAVHLQYPEVV